MASDVVDEFEIRELQYRYCHYLDAGDADRFAALFAEKGSLSAGPTEVAGHDELRRFVEDRAAGDLLTSVHMASNPLIDVTGGTATGRWYYTVMKEYVDGTGEFGVGTHDVVYTRTDDGWRIREISASRLQTVQFEDFGE